MKKLLATALLSSGLLACNADATPAGAVEVSIPAAVAVTPAQAPAAAPVKAEVQWSDQLAASNLAVAHTCPWYAPRCCGLLRNGQCVGNCVAQNAQCP